MTTAERRDIAETFRLEAEETLHALEQSLSALDAGEGDSESVHAMFRAAHTLKGAALTVGRRDVGELAHVVEELFVRWRDGRLRPTQSQTRWAAQVVDVLRAQLEGEASVEAGAGGAPRDKDRDAQRLLRVPQGAVDAMLTTVGELVLTHGRMSAAVAGLTHGQQVPLLDIQDAYARLHTELRDAVMHLRLVSVSPLLNRMRITANEAARKLGKELEFVVHGGDLALDTSLVEGLSDPFMHLVRNAVDHGIEMPEVRRECGKPPRGRLSLLIYKTAGSVVLTLSDDGRGLDHERIANRARERGLYPTGSTLSREAIAALIFEPGFSTAERVTEISGRGVGMDVVRRDIQAMRGTVLVQSEPGYGTSFIVSLPLDVTILDGTLVEAHRQSFIVPDERVIELVDVAAPSSATLSTLTVRGKTLPCIRLAALFDDVSACERQTALILSHANGQIGLMIDRSHGTQQWVIRPLGPLLRSLQLVTGAAVLGSGAVALLLDIDALVAVATRRDATPRAQGESSCC